MHASAEGAIVEELGVRRSLVEAIALKTLYHLGDTSLHELAQHARITRGLADAIFQRLRKEQLCQAVGMSAGVPRVALTQSGRTRAAELLAADGYVGPVPVSLADYVDRVRGQSIRSMRVHAGDVQAAFEPLVLEDETLVQLGTAVVSGRAIFLYGPPGTGKTAAAECLAELFRRDAVDIPWAIEVDGQIITVFDAAVHERVDTPGDVGGPADPRWVRCRRPRVMVGGELTIEMLDLQLNPLSRFYTAPVQLRANNGFLIVDDFGRQRIPPLELLNRWVVPLDRQLDYLTLAGGKKLEIPFDLFVVFATNLEPASVVEEAFLRRIQTKIQLGAVSPAQFREIFRRVAESLELDYDAAHADTLAREIQDAHGQPLRACHPRDVLHHLVSEARYHQRVPAVSREALARACRAYFVTRHPSATRVTA
jgi:predicted ATPase with chaperone activity